MSDRSSTRPLPLAESHRSAGCQAWCEEGGFRVPAHYGNSSDELALLTGDAVLHDASAWGRVELLGVDARRLLQGFCTVDVLGLEAGAWAYGLIPGAKGQVLADAVIAGHEDRLWLRLPPGEDRAIREHLGKYVIAEQVELMPMGDLIPLWVLGPQAGSKLRGIDLDAPPFGRHARRKVLGTEAQIEHGVLAGLIGVCFWVSSSVARAFAEDLEHRTGLPWCGREALESARIRAGVPRWGFDFGGDTLPQEAGLNAVVDYDKGCYLGQEVIARLHYRGREQRRLCVVQVERDNGDTGTNTSATVLDGDTEVGVLTSIDPLADEGTATGIALLRRSAFETKDRFTWGENGRLRVIRLLAVTESGAPESARSEPSVASSDD